LSSTSINPTRIPLFADRPPVAALAALSQPGPAAPVGAVVDLALYGDRGAGKTQLLYLWLRTLRARAPDLDGVEAEEQRALVTAALGGPATAPSDEAGLRHAVVQVPASSLLAEIGALGRLACYGRAGLWRGLATGVAASLALLVTLSLVRGSIDFVSVAAAAGLLIAAAISVFAAARARWLDLGEIEIALWDTSPPGGEPASLYPIFEALVRERRRRGAPWRAHAFAPVLVVDPLSLGDEPELEHFGRLRSALPIFAALGGRRPRALVAVNRWSAVEAVCRPDSDRGAAVEVRTDGAGANAPVRVSREVLRRLCLDAEDGREGDLMVHHLRYDAGAVRAERDLDGGELELTWAERAGDLAGESRRSAFRFIAALIRPVAE
jgi:hypothetical protein